MLERTTARLQDEIRCLNGDVVYLTTENERLRADLELSSGKSLYLHITSITLISSLALCHHFYQLICDPDDCNVDEAKGLSSIEVSCDVIWLSD